MHLKIWIQKDKLNIWTIEFWIKEWHTLLSNNHHLFSQYLSSLIAIFPYHEIGELSLTDSLRKNQYLATVLLRNCHHSYDLRLEMLQQPGNGEKMFLSSLILWSFTCRQSINCWILYFILNIWLNLSCDHCLLTWLTTQLPITPPPPSINISCFMPNASLLLSLPRV